jgi:transaldolase
MNTNPLLVLESFGQSIWIDYLHRKSLKNGEIKKWIEEDGVSGLTSNPSIFEKAFGESPDYDEAIHALALQGNTVDEMYQALVVDDLQQAADLFRPTYDLLEGRDGFVSLEVSPRLAYDTAGSIEEARRLWKAVNRPNLFIKIPATKEGLPAIQQLISEGINVNITLLFGLARYQEVADAYIAGLEALDASGKPLDRIASVASFFLSRIDVLIDPQLEKLRAESEAGAEKVAGLQGKVAISSAKVAYQIYQEIFTNERFRRLAQKGARVQRLLWASTSTKNPDYNDVMYVEPLIGRDTINTVPLETLHAYRDHGQPEARLEEGVGEAFSVLDRLGETGIDLDEMTQQLEDEGVSKFSKAFDKLTAVLSEKRTAAFPEPLEKQITRTDE